MEIISSLRAIDGRICSLRRGHPPYLNQKQLFIGLALAITDPVLAPGNKIELLAAGDVYFSAMLAAIRGAR